jgi:hypothetical protein
MTTDSEQRAPELLKRNGRVAEPNNVRLTAVRPDSPDDTPQLDYVSDENPVPVRDVADRAVGYDINDAVTADVDGAVPASTGLRLMGFFARESHGTADVATFEIVNGADASAGDAVLPIELSANQSAREWFGPHGIAFPQGISLDHVAGTFDCTILYRYGPA